MTKENDFTLQELELIVTQMPLISKNSDIMQKIKAKIRDMQPKTIRIGEFDVPEPLRDWPSVGTVIYVTCIDLADKKYRCWVWLGDDIDKRMFKQGHVHLTKEAAELHTKALISLTETK